MPPDADRPEARRPDRVDLRQIQPGHVLARVTTALEVGMSFIVPTSGSTGTAKAVVLSGAALQYSARAVADRLGGHGQWLAALSPSYVGGLGVYVRSVLAGTTPVAMPAGSFAVRGFADAAARMRSDLPRYVSLVPTQVGRLVAEPGGVEALRSFDRVLIGGAALTPKTLASLQRADIAWTHTYGMSETSGGVLHDGIPLRGVEVRCADADGLHEASRASGSSGRLLIAAPMLADGYLNRPELDALALADRNGKRWFRTSDLGSWDAASGRWVILGRVDDVIITGGHKVHPATVQDALEGLPGVAEAAVIGVADAQWGHAVAALIVPSRTAAGARLQSDPRRWVRDRLREVLPSYAIPWQVATSDRLPRLSGGKVDYRGVETAFLQEDDRI